MSSLSHKVQRFCHVIVFNDVVHRPKKKKRKKLNEFIMQAMRICSRAHHCNKEKKIQINNKHESTYIESDILHNNNNFEQCFNISHPLHMHTTFAICDMNMIKSQ